MKNIFDYAEKELSQDGFLCWLLESFEDPVIGEAARNLIFEFAKLAGFQIDKEKIKDVKTGRQYKHMDVTVDFTIDGKPYLIVIEDKTNSQEHNQLQGYADEVSRWNEMQNNKGRPSFLIYYKTALMDKDEIKRVEDAKPWKVFGIQNIANFFGPYQNSPDEILRSYSQHVTNLYKQQTTVAADKPMSDWNFLESRTYMKSVFDLWCKQNPTKKLGMWNMAYQGKYYSGAIYMRKEFSLQNMDVAFMPCLEIFFRKWGPINATLHIGTSCNQNGKKVDCWKQVNGISESYWDAFYKQIQITPMKSFKPRHYVQCIGSIKQRIAKTTISEVTPKLIDLIDEFYEFFDVLKPAALSGGTKQ